MTVFKSTVVVVAFVLGASSIALWNVHSNNVLITTTPPVLRRQLTQVLEPSAPKQMHLLIPRSRKVLSYHSSRWEQIWRQNLPHWQNTRSICNALVNEQAHLLHDYLNVLCTSRVGPPYDQWCVIDDGQHQLWYNTKNLDRFEVTFERPIPENIPVPPPQPVLPGPQHKHVMSWFVVQDEHGSLHEEYIEPLIGHLRFPLHKCNHPIPVTPQYQFLYSKFKGWILPPSRLISEYAAYFDAGATTWNDMSSTSLEWFATMWARSGIVFDDIHAYNENATPPDTMIPRHWADKVVFHTVDMDEVETHFVPDMIQATTSVNDYVLFKLDTTSPLLESSYLRAILDHENAYNIDELVWDHRIGGHYTEYEWVDMVPDIDLQTAYDILYKLRANKGIRAHSWI